MRQKQYDLAERQNKNVLEMDPNFLDAHWDLLWNYLRTSRNEDALNEATIISRLSKAASEGKFAFAFVYTITGKLTEARNLISELEERRGGGYISPFSLAALNILIGDVDAGFKWLEKAYEERDGHLPYLRILDWFAPIRLDSRYLSLLKRIGLQ